MAKTIDEGFEELRSNLEITDLQEKTVSTRQKNVRKALEDDFDILDSFLTGSYRRSTMIAPLKGADLDIFIVLDPKYYEASGQAALLANVKKALRKTYTETPDISPNGQAVTIRFTDFKVDVIPGFRRKGGGFLIPDSQLGRWIGTDPKRHVEIWADANKAHNGDLVPLLKMLKAWNISRGVLRSFHLETLALSTLENVRISDFPSGVRFVFDKARAKIDKKLPDPAGYSDDVAAYVNTRAAMDNIVNPLRGLTRPAWKLSGLRRTATWNRPLINGPPFSRATSHRIDDYRHMNHILTLQNAEPQLRLLRARRYTYLIGKRLLSLQVFLTVGVPVIGALGVLFWPNLKAYVAIASLVIAILDVTLFDRVQRTLLKRAATMQEQFDCIVLELPWEKFTVGAKLEPETIHAAASKHLGGADDPKLRDWYPAVVGDVPLYLARIICQRTNLWYDAKLRRQYGASVLGGTIALTVLLFIFGLIGGLTLESFVLTVLAPAAPIIIWGVREFFRQRDATDVLDRVKSEAEALWDRAKTGGCTEPDCTAQSRQFQNAIFERRSTSPLIFDWIYKIQRSGLEEQMNIGAQELVREIDAQLLKSGTV